LDAKNGIGPEYAFASPSTKHWKNRLDYPRPPGAGNGKSLAVDFSPAMGALPTQCERGERYEFRKGKRSATTIAEIDHGFSFKHSEDAEVSEGCSRLRRRRQSYETCRFALVPQAGTICGNRGTISSKYTEKNMIHFISDVRKQLDCAGDAFSWVALWESLRNESGQAAQIRQGILRVSTSAKTQFRRSGNSVDQKGGARLSTAR